jgi:thiosulfate reductase/polysulfide reductase chain A
VLGYPRGKIAYDFKNSKHIVLYGRNVFESLKVKEVNQILDAMDRGVKLTYIDPRASVTACKADRFLMIRPGTDYALNLALIHVILKERLYDIDFVNKWVTDLHELEHFVEEYTPGWAAKETEIPAQEILRLARELGEARPSVIFHGGWMLARYTDSFYSARSIFILNALMGNIEAKGGLIIAKGPKDAGVPPLRSFGEGIPEVKDRIVDADMPGPLGSGHIVNLFKAIKTGKPYPIKALFTYRYDPLASLPDPEEHKKILDNLDLIVSIELHFSETAWYSDVILPESTYLERASIIATQGGLEPYFVMRRPVIPPRYDTKPAWEIVSLIAERMGVGKYFPFKKIVDVWNYQLQGTGIRIRDFDAKGIAKLSESPIYWDRTNMKFATPTGNIEFVSTLLSENGIESLAPFKRPAKPKKGSFRQLVGRSAVHTHSQSQNNKYLNEIQPENVLWINDKEAEALGIKDGDLVEVRSNGYKGRIKAYVTPFIHPEAVFMLHGFGQDIPAKSRSFSKGLRDTKFQRGVFGKVDPVGGGIAFCENIVRVRKVKR